MNGQLNKSFVLRVDLTQEELACLMVVVKAGVQYCSASDNKKTGQDFLRVLGLSPDKIP